MSERVLILGGYGVFGGRLARLLLREENLDVVIAGRSVERARAFCNEFGGTPLALDASEDASLARALGELAPAMLIDAAGPFQAYGNARDGDKYRVARQTIMAGTHYLDLADHRAFVAGFAGLDALAREHAVCALSGASSVPALSSSAVDALGRDLAAVHRITTAILPGNRAPRGRSLVEAILSQAGQPFSRRDAGAWRRGFGWSRPRMLNLEIPGERALASRWASPFDAPDHALFPSRYDALSVEFLAGLELKSLHGALVAVGWLVRLRIVQSLSALTPVALAVVNRLEHLGTDRGGMYVEVAGRDRAGHALRRSWTLIAGAGDGPWVPAVPAYVMLRRILAGHVATGARACVGELPLDEAGAAMQHLAIRMHEHSQPFPALFEQVLGNAIEVLPRAVRALHDTLHARRFAGEATVERGAGLAAAIAARLAGFPAAGSAIPVAVEIRRTARGERWTRRFGARTFSSCLSQRAGDDEHIVWERFGPLSFAIRLDATSQGLMFPVVAARLGPIPLPKRLLPISETMESEDERGRFRFDVRVSLPNGKFVVRYAGWLAPVLDAAGPEFDGIRRPNANLTA